MYEKLLEVIRHSLHLGDEELTKDTHFVSDLCVDSIESAELIMDLEVAFDVDLADVLEEAKINTIGELYETLRLIMQP